MTRYAPVIRENDVNYLPLPVIKFHLVIQSLLFIFMLRRVRARRKHWAQPNSTRMKQAVLEHGGYTDDTRNC